MSEEKQQHLRKYFLFNYDNDYRAMIDNEVIGIKGVLKDLSSIFNSVDPLFELNNIMDNFELDQTSRLALKRLIFDMEIGDAVCLADKQSVLAIGIIESNYQFKRNKELPHFRKVKWLFQEKLILEDGNPRIKIRQVEKEDSYNILEEKINEALIEQEDNGLLINYLSRVTVENYIKFFNKAKLNPHELELLNAIYQNQDQGISMFDLQKYFDGIDIEESIEKLGRKISRRFHLPKVEGRFAPNIFNGVIRDGHICLVLKNELALALEQLDLVSKETNFDDDEYRVKDAMLNSVYPSSYFNETLELLLTKKNILLIGDWCTGKSYFARRLSYLVLKHRNEENILRLKMHPSQTYKELLFEDHSRILYRFIEKARKNTLENYVIIFEDTHEVNMSELLGEIEFLIDDSNREKEAALDVSFDDKKYYIPQNVYVIKTARDNNQSLIPTELSNVLIYDMKALYNSRFIKMFTEVDFGRWIARVYTHVNEITEKYNLTFNHGLFLKSSRGVNREEYQIILNYKIIPILKRVVSTTDYQKIEKIIKL